MTACILIRCDASLSIGSGHVIRCRTLARQLRLRGSEVLFICRRQAGDLIALLEQEFRVLILPERPLVRCDGLKERKLYGAWLGCSQSQDAEDCLEALASAGVGGVDWVVADHYGLDIAWQSQVLSGLPGSVPAKLLVIDDLADRPHMADLLLDQNFFGHSTDHRYEGLVPSHCSQLLGPAYALLGSEYAQLNPLVPPRKDLRRVLVFFGGVDPANLTCRTLEALMDPALAHLAVDVVLGLQSPHRQSVEEMVASRPLTTLHGLLPSLAGLISRADLAIGAGGATTWERACLKLPSLVVAIAENQVPFAVALHQTGHLQLLGDAASVSKEQICAALLARITDFPQMDMSCDLTDGMGASRLVLAMLGPDGHISLRPASADDESLFLRWSVNSQFISRSFWSQSITSTDDQNWFLQGLTNPNRLNLIATAADGCPIGQISFHRKPCSVEGDAHEAYEADVDLFLDTCAHGYGLVADLVRLGLRAMEHRWGPDRGAVAPMLNPNEANNVCFSRPSLGQVFNPPVVCPSSRFQSSALPPSRITVLSDRGSWLNHYLPELVQSLWRRGHAVRWIHNPEELSAGDVCLLLSCGRLLTDKQLSWHKHNLVVHESSLPQGQGWSPMTWQILDGASRIPVTLFEAVSELDAGPIYLQKQLDLQGQELVGEWRVLQAQATLELCLGWVYRYQEVVEAAKPQLGEPSYYRRRRPNDSELDPDRSLSEQFNLLRVVDNECYPAFFKWKKKRYFLKIHSSDVN